MCRSVIAHGVLQGGGFLQQHNVAIRRGVPRSRTAKRRRGGHVTRQRGSDLWYGKRDNRPQAMPDFLKLPTWANKACVCAVVETPRGSRAKLEFDPKLSVFTLAKPLMAGLSYPYDWGFIPSTRAEDGDPLDARLPNQGI